jgi:isoquinoline 1-oxidoreductase beta subunit
VKRRSFLMSALGVGGALIVGWCFVPPRSRLGDRGTLPLREDAVSLNGWVRVDRNGDVTVAMPRSEMGQGVYTALPMLVAEELDVPLERVRVEQAPIDAIYGNVATLVTSLPFHPDDKNSAKVRASEWIVSKIGRELGLQITGGSSSVRDAWLPMRRAGAAARAMLLEAAARIWKVTPGECSVEQGVVRHMGGRQLHLGELVAALREVPVPGAVTLKDPRRFRLIGKPAPRLDVPEKVTGGARFGIDVRLPGMLYAAVRTCPTLGGTLRSFDGDAALGMPGVVRVSRLAAAAGGAPGVAVVANSWWRATQALAKVSVDWDLGPHAALDGARLLADMRVALEAEPGFTLYQRGRGEAALLDAVHVFGAEYRAPYLAHATMEPMNCTAQFADGRLRIWAPTQVPSILRHVAARAAGIDAERVEVNVTLLGGGFGRRLEVDFVPQAVWIARDVSPAAVQLIWTREEDMTHDFYRPAAIARMRAGLNAKHMPFVWVSRTVSDAIVPQYVARAYPALAMDMPDRTTVEGLFDQSYEFAHRQCSHVTYHSPVPVGFWRSVGHSHNAFFTESFIDELAYEAKTDPYDFRRILLARHARYRTLLEYAAFKAGWGRAPSGHAQGIAMHESFGSIVAQVAEVSVTRGQIRVHRVVCAVDCGTVVNPDIVAQQMESGVVFGLTAALYGEITIKDGRVEQRNFPQYEMLRLADAPVVETYFLPDGDASPGGIGEVGTPPIAPAVANAVFRLTGQRLRSLPLRLPA